MVDPYLVAQGVKKGGKSLKVIGGLLAGIILLFLMAIVLISSVIGCLFSVLSPQGEEMEKNLYFQVKEELREKYNAKNDLDITYPLSLSYLYYGEALEDKDEIKDFLKEYFLTSETVHVGDSGSYTDYKFLSETEILEMMRISPFYLSVSDTLLISLMANTSIDSEDSGNQVITPIYGKYPMPLKGNITSRYGRRIDPVTGIGTDFHRGLDIRGKWHEPVGAIADGIVYKVNTSPSSWGNYVMLKHYEDGQSFYTLSAHLSKIYVKVDQKIKQGDIIGLEGGDQQRDPNPGNTTGHHLHFEVWTSTISNSHTDPAKYLFEN